jgi:N-acetyl-anhydromuramyl-L-alanine amidase AmpD
MSFLDTIHWTPMTTSQYVREETQKNTIYVHHTAGNANPYGVLRWWEETPERVGTSFVIGGKPTRSSDEWKDGDLIQGFSTKFWAYHLGLKQENMPPGSERSKILNSQSIGIEICNWGYLEHRDGKFFTYVNSVIPEEDVIELEEPYRGHLYWHKYTDAQLTTLKRLITYLTIKYDIPQTYKGDRMFELDMRAFEGEPGIWTHTSVRVDKTDCSPQPDLIKVLKEIGGTLDD